MKNFLLLSPALIEGIGPERESALADAKITTIAAMLWRGRRRVRQSLGNVSAATVSHWFSAALLLQIADVDPDLSEALVNGGCESVEELAGMGLQTIERAVRSAVDQGKLAKAPSHYALADIQRQAARIADTGMLWGRVVDAQSGAPLVGIAVRVAQRETQTDAEGRFGLSGIPAGAVNLVIEADGRRPLSTRYSVSKGRLSAPTTFRFPASAPSTPRTVRDTDGGLIVLGKAARVRLVARELNELPDPTYLTMNRIMASGKVRLVHLYRTQIGAEVQTEIVDVPFASVPDQTAPQDVLRLHSGTLTRTDLRIRDVARIKLEALLGPLHFKLTKKIVHGGPTETDRSR